MPMKFIISSVITKHHYNFFIASEKETKFYSKLREESREKSSLILYQVIHKLTLKKKFTNTSPALKPLVPNIKHYKIK